MLVDLLADVVRTPLTSPLHPEPILVEGEPMARWVSQQLSKRLGVWAHPAFPTARGAIDGWLDAALGASDAAEQPFEPAALMWSIADTLPRCAADPAFAPLARHTPLSRERLASRRGLSLCWRLASALERAVLYRPEIVRSWDTGEDGTGPAWMPNLWRRLVARHGPAHLSARVEEFTSLLNDSLEAAPPAGLPARICLFAPTTLPPLFVDFFEALSDVCEVHLLLWSPAPGGSRETDVGAELAARSAPGPVHPLQRSLSGLTSGTLLQLTRRLRPLQGGADRFRVPRASGLLPALQSALSGAPRPTPVLDPRDRSLRIHACHSPLREVEVLRDQIIAALERDGMTPHDVLIMTPDVETYAPLVEAVFGRRLRVVGAQRGYPLPVGIADRSLAADNQVVDCFLAVLGTLRGRLPAAAVLDLLTRAAIRERFGIQSEDLERIRGWVDETGICWGVDAAHRSQERQPELHGNTWRFGLERLMLGYAAGSDGDRMFGGVLPHDDIEGSGAELLGRLVAFCETLFSARDALRTPRPVSAWRSTLQTFISDLIVVTRENAAQHDAIHAALGGLTERAEAIGFDAPLDLDAVTARLLAGFQELAPSYGFLSRGASFCGLLPQRCIPSKMVCLLGMGAEGFPRTDHPPSFDLLAASPRAGDPTEREIDRGRFLEAILCARERLVISYVGQDIRGSGELPPSPVVSELIDTIAVDFQLPGAPENPDAARQAVREALVTEHPLQPFNPRYFGGDTRLFSYDEVWGAGARAATRRRMSPRRFFSHTLRSAGPAPDLALDELIRFLQHPVRRLLGSRLGLSLHERARPLPDREPLALDGLSRWALGGELLEHALRGHPVSLPAAQARGVLPLGTPGRCVYDDLCPTVEALTALGTPWRTGPLPAAAIDLIAGPCRLLGWIDQRFTAARVEVQFGRIHGRHLLGAWVRHLAMCTLPEGPRRTVLIGREGRSGAPTALQLDAVDAPAAALADLVELFQLGQHSPLPFFSGSSLIYARTLADKRDPTLAMKRAQSAFYAGTWPESDDPHLRKVFGRQNPLVAVPPTRGRRAFDAPPPSFSELSSRIYAPLLARLRPLDGGPQ